MYSLIILCAGKSERIKKDYFFDKCLLPVKQNPMIFKIIEYWQDIIDEVIIVTNNNNKEVIQKYIEEFYSGNIAIKFTTQHSGLGTYYGVMDGLRESANDKVILNWSDVCLYEETDVSEGNIVFTSNAVECRWKFEDGCFIEKGGPSGVVGIFVINELKNLFLFEVKRCYKGEKEILTEFDSKSFTKLSYEGFYDIGDSFKYNSKIRMLEDINKQFRKFNSIEFKEDRIIKKTNCKNIKNYEQNWYKNNSFDFTPKIYSYDPLVMERLDAVPAFNCLNRENEKTILDGAFNILNQIHTSKKTIPADNSSSQQEYITKTIARLKKVDFLFKFKDEFYVNGEQCKNPVDTLNFNIERYFADEFHVIHGDLQLSNLLMTKDNKFKVIDPRGYFGKTEMYGDAIYDYAKLFYGFCGMYAKFNSGENKVSFEDNFFELAPLLDGETYTRRRDMFMERILKVDYLNIQPEKIFLLHAIIWLSVTEYISNDVLSCLYAYLTGSLLFSEWIHGQ